ncbi:archaeosine synthase subunit alpha [Methanolobus halotolerans]|uniref:tRNA-ribosyltransferase n=1 Tax=Methanolobus halotolerans TaxID=2052935 RepID=A0A4E0Q2M7_9EURY|nr:archaeosine synthase subunit alpha [Methanolobus halotolerans]TGC07224.1 tRNA-ribosyltransferase [Methanolobus halotolerans]
MTRYFEVLQRDGAARIGKLLIGETTQTPHIIDTRTLNSRNSLIVDAGSVWELGSFRAAEEEFNRINEERGANSLIILPHQTFTPEVPDKIRDTAACRLETATEGPKGIVYRSGCRSDGRDLYVMEGAGCFENNARLFLDTLLDMKKDIAPDSAVYAPNICLPENLAMLAYLGVDMVDNTKALIAAHNDIYLTTAGRFYLDSLSELPCRCEACTGKTASNLRNTEKRERAKVLERHNLNALESELSLVREKIRAGMLREYVEGQCRTRPWLTALLRLADNEYNYLEEKSPIARSNQMLANSSESLTRVEIVRFAERVLERYIPPEADVLVLLPCSAKKPYSISNSHWKFINAIGSNRRYVHEIIITSPVGIVPRELELTYPAAHYDTAVTGHWDAEERQWVAGCLERYLQKNNYMTIIAHVEGAYRQICETVSERLGIEMIFTSSGSVTSPDSLKTLKEEVSKHSVGRTRNVEERKKDMMRSLADYQFGKGAGEILVPESATIKGPFPKYQIFLGKEQLVTLIPQYGTIAVTIAGAELMLSSGRYVVNIDDFVPRGSLLAPGVLKADPLIRPGDEVFVSGEKAICVGRAAMSGIEMQESGRGVAIDLRHVKKVV